MFILYFISTLLLSVAQAQLVDAWKWKFDGGVDLSQSCDSYTDCYNCTLANCNWKIDTCGRSSESDGTSVSVKDFLSGSRICGDQLNICKHKSEKQTNSLIESTELTFQGENAETSIYVPPNYFCTYEITQNGQITRS